MKPVIHLLFKVWVQPFYQRNAGFFLFLFVLLFGVVQNPLAYHYKIMQGIVSAYTTLVLAMLIWVLYACKCAVHILKLIEKEKVLLYQLQAIDSTPLCRMLAAVQAILFLPASVYMVFTIGVGIYMQQYAAAVMLCSFLIGIHAVSVAAYYQSLFRDSVQWSFLSKPVFTYRFPKGFFSVLLWDHLYKGKLKTVAVKFFSLLLLFIPLVWNSDHIELSDFVLFFQLSIAAHAVMVYDSVQFLENHFRVLRNVPVSLYKIFGLFVITYAVLLIPEIFFLYHFDSAGHLGVHISSLIIYYTGQLLFFTSVAYEKHQKTESYLLYVGLITVLSLLLTPFKSFGLIGCALIVIAFTLLAGNYYRYEPEFLTDSTDKHR